ncbi:hypothetical protein PTKIN_Ptkin05aG0145400 [Pterospermum kingtungense]
MRWVQFLGYQNVEFESDAKCVVDALHGSVVDVTEFGSILDLCRVNLVGENNFKINGKVRFKCYEEQSNINFIHEKKNYIIVNELI